MLPQESILSATGAAEKFAAMGKRIVAKPNTLIAELNNAIDSATLLLNSKNGSLTSEGGMSYSNFSMMVSQASGGDLDVKTTHDAIIDDVTNDISQYVVQHIAFAKNTVMPIVKDFHNSISTYLQTYKAKTAETEINLVEYDIPPVFLDETFTEQFKYMDGRKELYPEKTLSFGPKSHEELIALAMTSDKSYNEAILPTVTNMSEEELNAIWTSHFTHGTGNSCLTSLESALVIWLFANSLQNNPQDTLDNITGREYKVYLEQMKDYAATIIWNTLERLSLYTKSGTMVLSRSNKSITVYKPIYDQWLQAGGSPEVILGLAISDRNMTLESAITANKEDLANKWESYCTFFNASEENKRIDYFRNFIRLGFNNLVIEHSKDVEEYAKEHPEYAATAKDLIDQYTDSLKFKDMEDPANISLVAVGTCMFYYTDAYSILEGIEEAYKANPKIDIREAALLSTIRYLADYVSDQLTLA